ncbi:MAG: HTH domain-containing protein [Planctomycetaceae bacterium]
MDADLAGNGLHVPTFAGEWNVSERTVHRDLAVLRELGQQTVVEQDAVWKGGRERGWYHRYANEVRPLFVHNLK